MAEYLVGQFTVLKPVERKELPPAMTTLVPPPTSAPPLLSTVSVMAMAVWGAPINRSRPSEAMV